jgi:hypothetical protein
MSMSKIEKKNKSFCPSITALRFFGHALFESNKTKSQGGRGGGEEGHAHPTTHTHTQNDIAGVFCKGGPCKEK